MELWMRDWGTLRQGDERYRRQVGRVMILTVERSYSNREQWEARTVDANRAMLLLTRKFDTKEDAMRAIEKKAGRLLQDAVEDLARNQTVGV